MPTARFILFAGPQRWRVARDIAGPTDWFDCAIESASDAAVVAGTISRLLREQGYAGQPVVLALASEDCLAARVSTAGLPRGDRRALTYRLEEQLPLAAEDVVADFAPASDSADALAACVTLSYAEPLVAALEGAGVAIAAIVPAAIAAAQMLAAAHDQTDVVLLLNEPRSSGAQLSAITIRAGRPVDWALLPADADDVALHLAFITDDLGVVPRVCAFDLTDEFSDALSTLVKCDVHRQIESVNNAAVACVVSVLSGHTRPWFDFRRDTLAAIDPQQQHRRPLNLLLGSAAILLGAITLTLLIRAAAYDRAAAAGHARLVADFREHFPGWAVPANVPAVVAAERRKALTAVAAPSADGATYGSAMATLRTVLAGLPEARRFAIDSLSVQDTSLSLTGRLTAFEQADAIAAAARRSGMDVPPPQTRRAAGGTWTFVLQGNRPADSAAADPAGRGVASR